MNQSINKYHRKSYLEVGEIYFWTATINKWQKLLQKESFKNIIISSLEHLSNDDLLDVFAFVIMPNHIHLIWRINEHNGKETTHGSFLKFTAHEFKKNIKTENSVKLSNYEVVAANKNYEFWRRDSLAIHLYGQNIAYQKLDYIHSNPLADHWQLANDPCEYQYSTARLYEMGINDFFLLKI